MSDHEIGPIIRRALSVREHQRGWWIFLAALLYSGLQVVAFFSLQKKEPARGVEQALRLHGPLPSNQLPSLLHRFLLGHGTKPVVDDDPVWPRDILVRRLPVSRLWPVTKMHSSDSICRTLVVSSCSRRSSNC